MTRSSRAAGHKGCILSTVIWLLAAGRIPVGADVPDGVCTGDCDADGSVTIDELVKGVAIALGNAPVGECPAFDADQSASITIDELVRAVGSALTGCPPGEATPTGSPSATPLGTRTATPSEIPTATPGNSVPTPTPGAADVVAGELPVVANMAAGVSNVVTALMAAYEYGGSSGVVGGAGACPLGGTAAFQGNLSQRRFEAQLNNCRVSTAEGDIEFQGTLSLPVAGGRFFSFGVTAQLLDEAGAVTATRMMDLSGDAELSLSEFRCAVVGAEFRLGEGASFYLRRPNGAPMAVFFGENARLTLFGISYRGPSDCVVDAQETRIRGPAGLLVTAGQRLPVNFDDLRVQVTYGSGAATLNFVRGGLTAVCPGQTAVELSSPVPLTHPTGSFCPTGGEVWLNRGASRIFYGAQQTVDVDRDGNGTHERSVSHCTHGDLVSRCLR